MNWEDRFATMVKESSVKINEAKRRLHSFDNSRLHTLKALSPPSSQSTPKTGIIQAEHSALRTTGLNDSLLTIHGSSSATLLHSLYEKIDLQCQESRTFGHIATGDLVNQVTLSADFKKNFYHLTSKMEALEMKLNNQQTEMRQFKESLSQVVQKFDSLNLEAESTKLEEFKSEVRCELNTTKDCMSNEKDIKDSHKWNTSERLECYGKEDGQVLVVLDDIRNRLDKIEADLLRSHHNVESNSKAVEKNVALLANWKNENMESMNRLCKLQDLSVDEVKHLRSNLYAVQDRIHELENSLNDVRSHNVFSIKKNSTLLFDNDDINTKIQQRDDISISSNESLTNSSLNLEISDDGDISLEDLNLDEAKPNRHSSDLLTSSLDSLTASDESLSEK